MKYYVCFDGYGHPLGAVNEEELMLKYGGNTEAFLLDAFKSVQGPGVNSATGHVGTFSFKTEKELRDYLDSLGDEIEGFYEGEMDSRPYNF